MSDIQKYIQTEDELILTTAKISFVRFNRDIFAEFTKMLADNDIKTAHRIAHTLKSNAKQIGEEHLGKVAAEVEGVLRSGENRLSEGQLSVLEFELNFTLAKLKPLFDQANATEIVQTADKNQVLEILGKLEPMLLAKNPECEDLLDEIRRIPSSGELIACIERFNFKQAHGELVRLRNESA
jgi:HPt (histidine-containing phosphotransfer) domain-containing protein